MLTDWAERKLREISYGYLDLNCPEGSCHGLLAVYRICFGTSLFVIVLINFAASAIIFGYVGSTE